MDPLTRLQSWYAARADAEWEHGFGVRVVTIDNPGWMVSIDLAGTAQAAHVVDGITLERSENDWVQVWKEDLRLEGVCSPEDLGELLDRLMNILET